MPTEEAEAYRILAGLGSAYLTLDMPPGAAKRWGGTDPRATSRLVFDRANDFVAG